jgi:hypothetical protein
LVVVVVGRGLVVVVVCFGMVVVVVVGWTVVVELLKVARMPTGPLAGAL